MLSTWDDLWEFWDFWKFFENFEFHKISADYWSCIPRSCSKFRTVKKYVGATFFFSARPKSKMGSNLSSQMRHCNQLQSATTNWTHIPEFWKVYNFIYGIVYRSKKWSFWSLTSLADSLKSTFGTNAVTHVTFVTGQLKKMRQSSLIEPNCWV